MNRGEGGGRREDFQPISVRAPGASRARFFVRRFVDLQLDTIARPLRTTLSSVPSGHNIRFLDIGAGESPWREWLPEDTRYTALEVSHVDHFKMSAVKEGVVFYEGAVMPFADSSFDGALCIEVMEHAADPELLLREAARCLVDNGLLVLTVPWSARRHHIPFDFHRFTRERLEIMLTEAGFEFIAIRERGSDWSAIANKLVVAMMRLLAPPSTREHYLERADSRCLGAIRSDGARGCARVRANGRWIFARPVGLLRDRQESRALERGFVI
jgi:SAM-dependent methyltransferase